MRGSGASAHGISDLPMQLLIGACLMAMTVPIFFSAYGDLSEDITESSVSRSIESLVETMEEVLSGEDGSISYVDMDLSGFGSCRMDQLSIGGPLSSGVDQYLIRYSLTTGASGKFSLDPPFPITSESGTGLKLDGGSCRLLIQRSVDSETQHLIVSIAE